LEGNYKKIALLERKKKVFLADFKVGASILVPFLRTRTRMLWLPKFLIAPRPFFSFLRRAILIIFLFIKKSRGKMWITFQNNSSFNFLCFLPIY